MSVTFLKVYISEKSYGTLEIHAQYWDGGDSFGWEWYDAGPE